MQLTLNSPYSFEKQAIREFQDPNNTTPKVIAISYKTGQCGITLTAASRVYLLEPCILPSDEVQAAGRISRLGQTKEISLVRLVAKNTVDEAIIEMHAQLASGAKKFTPEGNLPASCIVAMLKKGASTISPIEWNVKSRTWHIMNQKLDNYETGINKSSQPARLSKVKEMISRRIDSAIHDGTIDTQIKTHESGRVRRTIDGVSKIVYSSSTKFLERMCYDMIQDMNNKSSYVAGSSVDSNSAIAGMYGLNPMLKYVEEYTPSWGVSKAWRLKFSADLKSERAKVAQFLLDVVRYGDPAGSTRVAGAYMNCN